MTATLEAPPQETEALVSQPEATVLFMSRRKNLTLTKTPVQPVFGAGGRKMTDLPGERVEFVDGVLRVDPSGTFRFKANTKGPGADVLAFLEEHPLNGDLSDGFWRVEQVAPAVSAEELKAITRAAMGLDEDQLVALIAQERGGWDRADVLDAATDALGGVREIKAEAARQAAEEASKGVGAPPAGPGADVTKSVGGKPATGAGADAGK